MHHPTTDNTADIVIVGGGLVGLLTAARLQSRYHIIVVDPDLDITARRTITDSNVALSDQATHRVTAVNPSSQALINQVTDWRQMGAGAYPYYGMHIIDTANQQSVDFDGQQLGQLPMGWMAHNNQLLNLLSQTLDSRHVTLLNQPFEPHANHAAALCEGRIAIANETYHAQLIIAADGANSRVRQCLSPTDYRHEYNQTGVIATIEHAHDNAHIARQWFIGQDILAFLPIAPQRCSIVWSTSDPGRLQQADDASFCRWLSDYSHGAVGTITAATPRLAFPLRYGRVDQMVHGKTVLIGDAAHRVHPMAGLGANLGFEDAGALAQQIEKRITASALARFSRQRAWHNWRTQNSIDTLHRIYQWQHPLLTTARGIGMQVVDRCSPIKHAIANAAAGNPPTSNED